MGEAKRRKAAADTKHTAPDDASYDELNELNELARKLVVKQILETTKSPMLRHMHRQLMTIDPSGRLLCAHCQHVRDVFDHVLARKGAGMSNAEIEAACMRDYSSWLAKGPERIIAEFDERMRIQTFGLPSGTPMQS